ncbi:MAG: triose-phosphate isomerase [Psychrobium sp.]|nr:triose-phosphate isomerase [Psychrobium sp.]
MNQLKPLIAANWKMNGNNALIAEFTTKFNASVIKDVDVVVCPASVYLESFKRQVSANNSVIQVGAQNLSDKLSGAFTGEISTEMLSEIGIDHVIVGHSERRSLFGETPELVAKKYQTALASNITPILCTGESEQQRDAKETFTIIANDIDAVVDLCGIESFKNGVIAYEPVWAIGTGKSATPDQAQEVHQFIRSHLAKHDEEVAAGVRILYGGSVNEKNAAELFKQQDINGALVGGAGLVVEKFMSICQNA